MTKNQKIILFGAIGVFVALAALIILLIVNNAGSSREVQKLQEQTDSLMLENNKLELANLTAEFQNLNSEFEGRQFELGNDSLLQQYQDARNRIEELIKELDKEKQSNRNYRKKIEQLEAEIASLKGIARHYLEEIARLDSENKDLKNNLSVANERNQQLEGENASQRKRNLELTEKVERAEKLKISGLQLMAYNKNDKQEKKVNKAKKLGVSFKVLPNDNAQPGMKTFYVTIISPEGTILGSGETFSCAGSPVVYTASRGNFEYDNNELPVTVYWTVNSTLTPGDYSVEVYTDDARLGSGTFNLKK